MLVGGSQEAGTEFRTESAPSRRSPSASGEGQGRPLASSEMTPAPRASSRQEKEQEDLSTF
jgi:hypothetical protein